MGYILHLHFLIFLLAGPLKSRFMFVFKALLIVLLKLFNFLNDCSQLAIATATICSKIGRFVNTPSARDTIQVKRPE